MTLVALAVLAGCGGGAGEAVIETRESEEYIHEISILDTFELLSLEESIASAEVIARVQLDTFQSAVEPVYISYLRVPNEPLKYAPAIVYTFTVREYIIGSGGDELRAVVIDGDAYPTEEEARQHLGDLPARDGQWDDREAIIFLVKRAWVPSTTQADRHLMGYIQLAGGVDFYTVSSPYRRAWLPDAAPSSGGSRSATPEQRFLLSAPSGAGGGASGARSAGSSASASETITLMDLKAKVGAITAEIAAGDGSEEHKECVEAKYWGERVTREEVAGNGPLTFSWAMISGMAGGHVLDSDSSGDGIYPDTTGRYWTSGPDAELFRIDTSNITPRRFDVPLSATPDAIWYDRATVTTRPLPAGVYRFRTNGIMGYRMKCNLISDYEREHGGSDNTVTVTAPSGVTHEAFFDPVDLNPGVGANSSSGVLKPTTFGSNSLDRIEWASGTLKVNLTGSHAGQHIDFLDAAGDLLLTLQVDDATADGVTLTWAVAEQPWESDDKLMARLYRKTMELCAPREHFAKPGACYQDPVFAGAPFSFTVAEDIAVGSAVGTVAVSHPEMATTTVAIISGDDNGHFAVSDEGAITTAQQLDSETTPSYTLTVQADAGRWSRATAEVTVTVTPPSLVTVTLSPREEQSFTYTDITIEWSDPGRLRQPLLRGVV